MYVSVTERADSFPSDPAVTLSFGQQCVEAGFRIGRGSRQECHRRLLAQP